MKELRELVYLTSMKRVKKVEIVDWQENNNGDGLCSKFYQGIASGKYKNDKDAANDLYGTTPQNNKYQKLKSRLREKLLLSSFFLDVDFNQESSYHRAFYYCYQNTFLAFSLLLNSARNNAVTILEKTLRLAFKYQIHDLVFLTAKQLRKHYSLHGKQNEFLKYDQLVKRTFKMLQLETLSEEYFEEIRLECSKVVSYKQTLIEKVKRYIDILQKYISQYDSFILHFDYYRISIFYFQMIEDYHSAIEMCKAAKNYLLNNPIFIQNIRLTEIATMTMDCCLSLRDYETGKECADTSLAIFPKGNVNWLIFLEYYFLLAMHTGNYRQAEKIFLEVIKNPHFFSFAPGHREKWRIFEAYLYYALSPDTVRFTFNLGKFLNEVHTYSKDKRGYNISILIAQILFLMKDDKRRSIIDRSDALKIYCSRYLNSDSHNFRSKIFLKMLLIMIHYGFCYQKTKEATQKYLDKLQTSTNIYKGTIETIEMIPYERLWKFILRDLKKLNISYPGKITSSHSYS